MGYATFANTQLKSMPSILITGGAGFIGVNSAIHFAKKGWNVSIIDNLSRKGADQNLKWLHSQYPSIKAHIIDIRDFHLTHQIVSLEKPDMLLHLAAQVAVTTSYINPREDFEINALGTFNLLESIRMESTHTFFLFASTNKVYGGMESIAVELSDNGYKFADMCSGVNEFQPLDFHSPYGCSKGVADQYTIDYARIYDLKTCSFRQSCIYGERQFGIEDQGWVAWFTIAALLGKTITVYGDGWQTRDVLNVDDLAMAYEAAWHHQDEINGQAFNIGGGPDNTLCLNRLILLLENKLGVNISPLKSKARPGDQPVFICDISKAKKDLGWTPSIGVDQGVNQLINWVSSNRDLFVA
jgi:CDP-paratose 2-epimerase